MKKQTIAINTPYVREDVYGSLSVPVYHNVSFEFSDAQEMSDVFCNRIKGPDYARVENPTVTNLEQRVRQLTDAAHVTAFTSGMAHTRPCHQYSLALWCKAPFARLNRLTSRRRRY